MSLKLCSMRSYVHFDCTWMLSVLAYMSNVISSEFVIGYDDEFANNTLVTINLLAVKMSSYWRDCSLTYICKLN